MSKPVKVLIVDDNPADITLLKISLQKCAVPIEIQTANDGEEVLQRVLAGDLSPDVIVMDVVMPKIDGGELLRRLKSISGSAPPIILMSSIGNPREIARLQEGGAADFMLKEITIERFIAKVDEVLVQKWIEPIFQTHAKASDSLSKSALSGAVRRARPLMSQAEVVDSVITDESEKSRGRGA